MIAITQVIIILNIFDNRHIHPAHVLLVIRNAIFPKTYGIV